MSTIEEIKKYTKTLFATKVGIGLKSMLFLAIIATGCKTTQLHSESNPPTSEYIETKRDSFEAPMTIDTSAIAQTNDGLGNIWVESNTSAVRIDAPTKKIAFEKSGISYSAYALDDANIGTYFPEIDALHKNNPGALIIVQGDQLSPGKDNIYIVLNQEGSLIGKNNTTLTQEELAEIYTSAKQNLDLKTYTQIMYTVKPGDNLWNIAKKYNDIRVEDIKEANALTSDIIQPGQELKIPAYVESDGEKFIENTTDSMYFEEDTKNGIVSMEKNTSYKYKIKSGETFGAIAHKFKINLKELINLNSSISPEKLKEGIYIHLPSTTPTFTHYVQKGEFISNIRENYGMTQDEFISINPGLDIDNVKIGQEVQVYNISTDTIPYQN